MKEIQMNNEFHASGEEYNYKVRKPYTITKQRERWSKEEHNNFLEALKLYGRAWRRIEEHVGTKTAVQIRSHAQKFFSKVARESGNSSSGSIVQIEIPPPRPKRKPTHPYPRKVGTPCKRDMVVKSKEGSCCPSSGSDQENGSPTSVLWNTGSSFCDIPVSCTSQISSAGPSLFSVSGNEKINEEQSRRTDDITTLSLGRLEMVHGKFSKAENSPVVGNTPVFKLFGRAVLITDPQNTSLSATESIIRYDPQPGSDADLKGTYEVNLQRCMPPAIYCISLGSDVAVQPQISPQSAFYGDGQVEFVPSIPTQSKINLFRDKKDTRDDNIEKIHASSVGPNCDSSSDNVITHGCGNLFWSLMSSESSSFTRWKADPDANPPNKGFLPYKRHQPEVQACYSEKDSVEEKRIRLCL